jgi:hypothetical protein
MKSLQSILSSMISYISGLYPKADTSEGSIISDIVIGAPSQEIYRMYEQDQITSDNQALATANADGLTIHGSNLTAPRKSALVSSGIETFFRYSAPASDITIPAGTIVTTSPGPGITQVQFRTISTVTMFAVMSSSYLNPSTGVYEIQSNIECITPGTIGVVGSQTIVSLINPVAGIDGCYNSSATYGGEDVEDTETYRQRLSKRWKGNSIGTDNGILSSVLSQTGVDDAIIVGHGQSVRETYGGVDVYVKGTVSSQYIDVFQIDINSPPQSFVFTKQPVIQNGVQSIIYGASGSVAPPSYSIIADTSQYAGSVLGQDKIQWSTPLPSILGTVYVTYSYNSLIESLQNIFRGTSSDILNTDLLVLQAAPLSIDITFDMKVTNGFDSLNVVFDVQDAIALFFNALSIGAQVQAADVLKAVLDTSGVDDVKLPFTLFQSTDGRVSRNSFGDLVLPFNTYAVAGNIIINVVSS